MLTDIALRAKLLLLVGASLAVFGVQAVCAQVSQQEGRYGRQSGDQTQQQQVRDDTGDPFIHGVSLGIGLAVYQGDFSRNPEHNIVKYLAGSGSLSLRAGVDHRMGRFEQYGVGTDLVYNRLSGQTTGGSGFSANTLALDFYADYELPYIKQGLFRVFVGGGPNFIISPSYDNFPDEGQDDNYEKLGSRVTGSLKIGVTVIDKFRIGTRIASSDLIDGYKGFDPDGVPDIISFVNFSYRFDVR